MNAAINRRDPDVRGQCDLATKIELNGHHHEHG